MSTDVKQQAVFEKVFSSTFVDDESLIESISVAFKKLRTKKEMKAILLTLEWIIASRGKSSNFMLSSTVSGVTLIEERQFHNL